MAFRCLLVIVREVVYLSLRGEAPIVVEKHSVAAAASGKGGAHSSIARNCTVPPALPSHRDSERWKRASLCGRKAKSKAGLRPKALLTPKWQVKAPQPKTTDAEEDTRDRRMEVAI